MHYINSKQRQSLGVFRTCLYQYLKENNLRYSDQRERVLKLLYLQSYPATAEKLLRLLNEEKPKSASYPTMVRHLNFFNKLGWLKVVEKTHQEYLLVQSPPQFKEKHYEDDEYDPL
jgi:Fe2+ or Zn2+ uptake regulation protein